MKLSEAQFPVLAFSPDVVTAYETYSLFSFSFFAFVESYKGLVVVDSRGKFWKISKAIISEYLDPWWVRIFRGKSAVVELMFDAEMIEPTSIDRVKEMVLSRLRMKSGWAIVQVGFVEELGREEAKIIERAVKEANSFCELNKILLIPEKASQP